MILLTEKLISNATGATSERAKAWRPHLQAACERFGIDTTRRAVGFLSQIGHESGGLTTLSENLNYSSDALLKLFGRHRISQQDAVKFGRTKYQQADQVALSNILYGGIFGRRNLGNTQQGDGWRYRGRGLKQITGRANYAAAGAALGLDLLEDPDLVLEHENAANTAGWFWHENGLNQAADRGDVAAMTRKINGGTIGLAQRQALYDSGISHSLA